MALEKEQFFLFSSLSILFLLTHLVIQKIPKLIYLQELLVVPLLFILTPLCEILLYLLQFLQHLSLLLLILFQSLYPSLQWFISFLP